MNQDFLDVFRALSETDSRFLLVGAFALAIHAEPRATGDIDIWVEPTHDNAQRVYQALTNFGAPLADLTIEDLKTENIVFQMGVAPNRIDILTSLSGLVFSDAWLRRQDTTCFGMNIPVIGKDDLIINKKATGRPKDLVDLEILNKS